MNNYINNNINILDRVRNIRNELLNKTDKYILSDYPISLSQQMIIKTYRQDLRDSTPPSLSLARDTMSPVVAFIRRHLLVPAGAITNGWLHCPRVAAGPSEARRDPGRPPCWTAARAGS